MASRATDSEGHLRNKRPSSRGTAAYPRKRAVTACQVCRARRTKCDNAKPTCGFCQKIGAHCIQSPVDLSSFDPASLRILERLDELERTVKEVGAGGKDILRDSIVWPPATVDLGRLLPFSLESLLHQDNASGLPTLIEILHNNPGESVVLPSSSPLSIVAELESKTANTLLDNFFNYVHVKNPILREEATRSLVSRICLHGIDWSPESCLALLICAIGSLATPFGNSIEVCLGSIAYTQSQSYFQAVQKRIGLCMASPGVIEAQCLFLTGVYLMHVFQPFHAWRFFSQALACCQGFDFVTSTSNNEQWDEGLSKEKQAIYWSAWKSEQELRSCLEPRDFALPAAAQSLYPSFFPSPPTPADLNDLRSGGMAFREQFSWYFYLTEISLRRLTARLADDMVNQAQSLASTLPDREAELTAWVESLPPLLRLESPANQDDICKFVIRGHVADVYEMLYWPFLIPYIDRNNDVLGGDGVEVDRALTEIALQKHIDRIWLNKPGFKHRHHGTWLMIRSCTRSALVLIKCASHGGVSMPVNWQEAVREVLDLNRFWQSECRDAFHRLPLLEQAFMDVETMSSPQ